MELVNPELLGTGLNHNGDTTRRVETPHCTPSNKFAELTAAVSTNSSPADCSSQRQEAVTTKGDEPESSFVKVVNGQSDDCCRTAPAVPNGISTKYSLGLANAAIIILGTMIALATLGFLAFLWHGQGREPDGKDAYRTWRVIMLSGRITQIITISSLIIRAAISAQTAICTSFVAALILERQSVPLSQSAPLSVFRSVNSGPRQLIWLVLKKGTWSRILHPEILLLLLLGMGNIAVQFSSTILLSDLEDGTLVGFPSNSQRNLTVPRDRDGSLGGWTRPPHDFSLFGELYSEYTAEPDSNGVSDTGSKRHAMLPYTEAANRTVIRNYQGPALVYSSRVACMPPTIVAEISTELQETTDSIYGYMIGRVQVYSTLSRAGLATSSPCYRGQCLAEIPFNCALPTVVKKEDLVSSYCTPQESDVPVWTSPWKVSMRDWITTASVFLVFSSSVDSAGWELLNSSSIALPLPTIGEEWASYNFGSNNVVNATLCYLASNVMLSNVTMSTNRELKEPTIGHDTNATDTNDIRRFLGVDPTIRDLSDRGILTIKEISDSDEHVFNASSPDAIPNSQYAASILDWFGLETVANQTFAGCEICEGDFHASSREFQRIFADSIASTRRASVALQAVYTVFIQSMHDQLLEFLSIPMAVEVLRTQLNIIPIRRVGFVAIAIIVTINTICILILTVLYILFVRYSVVGSFWHTISQVASDTSSAVLYYANQKNDHHVSDYLGNNDRLVRLVRSDDTGIVNIVEAK